MKIRILLLLSLFVAASSGWHGLSAQETPIKAVLAQDVQWRRDYNEARREQDDKKLPLLVAHTHRHLDHRAGDPQFASLPSVQIVPIDLEGVRTFFGFTNWPSGIGTCGFGWPNRGCNSNARTQRDARDILRQQNWDSFFRRFSAAGPAAD